MLPYIETKTRKLEKYKGIISDKLFEEIKVLAKDLKGLKVTMINSTPRGGGVAEILRNLVPLMKGVGIEAHWHIIPPGRALTKEMNNALQGESYSLSSQNMEMYKNYMKRLAKIMSDMRSDIWVMHDPQPAGIVHYLPSLHPSISHIHIDTTRPNKKTWNFIEPFLLEYDRIVFWIPEFVPKTLPRKKVVVLSSSIDPLSDTNKPLKLKTAKMILENFGIDTKRPLVSQILRFDPWKDPFGSLKAYRLAKKKIPNLQLALVGLFLAVDDPDAMRIFKDIQKVTKGDPDIFLFSSPQKIGSLKVDIFVNAFQTGADVILQKSIREGFGLTVTEAMWKGKVVIGGNVGGIKVQIKNGKNGFLVSSPEEAAKRIVQLLQNPRLAKKLGKAAHETVKEKFLLPRFLRDYLKLFKELI